MISHRPDNGYRKTYKRSCGHLVAIHTEDLQMTRKTNNPVYRRIVNQRVRLAARSDCDQCADDGKDDG